MAGNAHLKKYLTENEKYHYLVSRLKSCQLNSDVISKQKLYGVLIKIITNCVIMNSVIKIKMLWCISMWWKTFLSKLQKQKINNYE